MVFFFTKRNHCSIPCRIEKAGKSMTVKLFKNINSGEGFINAEIMNFVNKRKVTFPLLTSGFCFLTELPGNTATAKNGNNTAKQPTELTCSENGRAQNKRNRIGNNINSAVNSFRHDFQPIAVPDTETQTIFSRLFCHENLFLVIIFLRLWLMQHMETFNIIARLRFIFVAHSGSFLWWWIVMPVFRSELPGLDEDTTTRPGA
ncbi:Uncharacterised protein [Serratia ficaria]|nr:Uncharacterised protein [Serratia ficaria]